MHIHQKGESEDINILYNYLKDKVINGEVMRYTNKFMHN